MAGVSLHDRYIDHCMSCKGCFAPRARYCDTGKALWADYLSDHIMGLPDRLARRHVMVVEKRQNPHLFPALNDRVRERMDQAEV